MPRPALTPNETRVLDAIEVGPLVEAVQSLVRVESWAGRETRAQELVAELCGESGLDVDVHEIDVAAVQAHPDCSWEIERAHALGVSGTLRGRGTGRSLVLNGHVDVVPPGDERLWSHPPFGGVVADGRIWGRGSLDMKGPLAAGLFALRAIRRAGVDLAGSAHLQSVVGEEDGGLGTLAAILRGPPADGAIVMEPTELVVVPVQAGCLNFRIRASGLAAHGAVREEGVSAFEKVFALYDAIGTLETERNAAFTGDPLFARYAVPFPISIGTMRGGDWASSVPDHASMEGRMGVRPGESFDAARRALEDAVAAAATRDPWMAEHPPSVEWWGGRFQSAVTPADDPLTLALQGAATDVLGREAPLEAVPFGADAGLLANVGGMATVLFGAGDIRNAHRPDEHVSIDALVAMARTLAVAALRYCG
jgi:acetylornithine deacetylase